MPLVRFKLKKANAITALIDFDGQPSWKDLALNIAQLYNIPLDRIGVAFIKNANEVAILSDEQELQCFYMSLDQSSEEVKFVVQDTQMLDAATTITSTWSPGSNLPESDDEFSLFCCVLNTSDPPFSVNIGKDKVVDNLKEAIKKKMGHTYDEIEYYT